MSVGNGELYQVGTFAQEGVSNSVKSLTTNFSMRQICSTCSLPLTASDLDAANEGCFSCHDGHTLNGKTLHNSTLCRLLVRMSQYESDSNPSQICLPCGVFSIPVSATLMLQVPYSL